MWTRCWKSRIWIRRVQYAGLRMQGIRRKIVTAGRYGVASRKACLYPCQPPAPQPASSPAQPATVPSTPVIVGQPPVVAKVQRNLVMAGGKKKAVEWLQVRGKVRGFG